MGISIFAFVVVLGTLIFFHELGHFLFARLFGVGVETFSLGFGPRLVGRTVGRTDYRLSAIPLGGYVKMVGENVGDTVDPSDEGLSFYSKSAWKRFLIVAAGPVFNVLLAILIFFVFHAVIGIEDILPRVRQVTPGSPAATAGLIPGDRILAVNSVPMATWGDVADMVRDHPNQPLTLRFQRDGQQADLRITAERKTRTDPLGDPEEYFDLGIAPMPPVPAVVGGLSDGFPAKEAGLAVGDRITAINGRPIQVFQDMIDAVAAQGGESLLLSVDRNGEQFETAIKPKVIQEKNLKGDLVDRYLLGIRNSPVDIPDEDKVRRRYGPIQAVSKSMAQTWWVTRLTVVGIYKMIVGAISPEYLGGPIYIAQLAGQQARRGASRLIEFIAFISINLAILNILPIPVLDGGHLLFFAIEAIVGRPLNDRIRENAQKVGLLVLLAFMLLIIYNDINRLITG